MTITYGLYAGAEGRRYALNRYRQFRWEQGHSSGPDVVPPKLLSRDNHKSEVTLENAGVKEFMLYLTPADGSGYEMCAGRTPLCTLGGLGHGPRYDIDKVARGRLVKTLFFNECRNEFLTLLASELHRISLRSDVDDVRVRLNGTSDVGWEQFCPALFQSNPRIKFMDYTKIYGRMRSFLAGKMPPNYKLVYSVSELTPDWRVKQLLEWGAVCAVVFDAKRGDSLPEEWLNYPVIDGDLHDDLWRDYEVGGVVRGLRAKQPMAGKVEFLGFVKQVPRGQHPSRGVAIEIGSKI